VDSLIQNIYAGICHVFQYLKHGHLSRKLALIILLFVPFPVVTWSKFESSETCLLCLRVRFPQGACLSVCCGCCVLSATGFCFGLFTLPEEFYLVWWVRMWSWSLLMRKPWLTTGCCTVEKKLFLANVFFSFKRNM
jgi:hypothetical protein